MSGASARSPTRPRSHLAAHPVPPRAPACCRTWFVVDALSSFPVELIDLLAAQAALQAGAGSGAEGDSGFGYKILRALRMVRLLRMLKLLNINKYIDALEDRFGVNMQILQIVKMIFGLLYLMHLLGCFWFFVGTTSGNEVTWLTEYDGGTGATASTDVQYLYSVYWALTTLTTVGYGDIVPANNAERTYALGSLLIGALVFGYMLSSIGDLLSNVDKNAVKLDAKLDEVKDFTRWHKMHPDLAARVRRYFEYFVSRKSAMDEEEIIANLAPGLRREVVAHLLQKTSARLPMFSPDYCSYADEEFQLEVHPLLKPVVYEAGELVVRKGSMGEDLYYLNRGVVSACSALDTRILFPITETGSFFGEHILCNQPSDITYKALTRSEFLCLSKRDLYSLLERHPHARGELAEFVFEDVLRHKMLRFWALRMTINDVSEVDKRAGAALRLQVSWMKRQIIALQDAKHSHDGSLEWLMPGVFGVGGEGSAGGAVDSPRAAGASSSQSGRREVASGAEVVSSALLELEGERSKMQRREAAMERQLVAIQTSLAQLVAGRDAANQSLAA